MFTSFGQHNFLKIHKHQHNIMNDNVIIHIHIIAKNTLPSNLKIMTTKKI